MPLCGLYEGGDHCGALGERRYMNGWRCPRHTPAALAGRTETTPDPAYGAAALRVREDWTPKRDREYGTATTDPLGREGPGWLKGKNGLPVRDKSYDKGDHK